MREKNKAVAEQGFCWLEKGHCLRADPWQAGLGVLGGEWVGWWQGRGYFVSWTLLLDTFTGNGCCHCELRLPSSCLSEEEEFTAVGLGGALTGEADIPWAVYSPTDTCIWEVTLKVSRGLLRATQTLSGLQTPDSGTQSQGSWELATPRLG